MTRFSITLPPITITKGGGVITPVSLEIGEGGGEDEVLLVNYSDGSQRIAGVERDNSFYVFGYDGSVFLFVECDTCSDTPVLKSNPLSDPEGVSFCPITAVFHDSSCSMVEDKPQGTIDIYVGGVYWAQFEAQFDTHSASQHLVAKWYPDLG